ncbi:MAG: FeoB-associated Cys-rich membrane protein [Anaerorhabdus sp.]
MMDFLQQHGGTLVVGLVLLFVVVSIIRRLYRNRKSGSVCSHCDGCNANCSHDSK